MDLKGNNLKKFEDESLPDIISNLFLLARRIQNTHTRLKDRPVSLFIYIYIVKYLIDPVMLEGSFC